MIAAKKTIEELFAVRYIYKLSVDSLKVIPDVLCMVVCVFSE